MIEIQNKKTGEIYQFPTPEGGMVDIDVLEGEPLSKNEAEAWFAHHNKTEEFIDHWKMLPWRKKLAWKWRMWKFRYIGKTQV